MVVEIDGSIVEFEKEEWKHLQLAYAMSIHKAQGGQAKVVMTVLSDEHDLNYDLIFESYYQKIIPYNHGHVFRESLNPIYNEVNDLIHLRTNDQSSIKKAKGFSFFKEDTVNLRVYF